MLGKRDLVRYISKQLMSRHGKRAYREMTRTDYEVLRMLIAAEVSRRAQAKMLNVETATIDLMTGIIRDER